ncbi:MULTISPECIES: hypothetical protein [Kamptonema]|nr:MULTISPECIES: hypothetical protein [Kamptonema]CBN54284.1 hypothetical protein OSCI_780012 [Kamptonema sp. PCC 6506]
MSIFNIIILIDEAGDLTQLSHKRDRTTISFCSIANHPNPRSIASP